MITLSRKQVKAFLDTISSDGIRPAICEAVITKYDGSLYLTATNSYILAALQLENRGDDDAILAKAVTRADILRWYKLAGARDMFTEDTLRGMLQPTEHQYPNWSILLKEQAELDVLAFNATYAMTLQTLAGTTLAYTLTGNNSVMIARDNDNIHLLMPVGA